MILRVSNRDRHKHHFHINLESLCWRHAQSGSVRFRLGNDVDIIHRLPMHARRHRKHRNKTEEAREEFSRRETEPRTAENVKTQIHGRYPGSCFGNVSGIMRRTGEIRKQFFRLFSGFYSDTPIWTCISNHGVTENTEHQNQIEHEGHEGHKEIKWCAGWVGVSAVARKVMSAQCNIIQTSVTFVTFVFNRLLS